MQPIANRIDRYVKDILRNTPKSADQVTIEPDGQWELYHKEQSSSNMNGFPSDDDDDDDDLIEVTNTGQTVKAGGAATAAPQRTPSVATTSLSREQSTPSRSASSKRPIAAVIDLTSSGDEDEEPISRPPKRQIPSNGPGLNGIPSIGDPATPTFPGSGPVLGPPNGLTLRGNNSSDSPLNSNVPQSNGAPNTLPLPWGHHYAPHY